MIDPKIIREAILATAKEVGPEATRQFFLDMGKPITLKDHVHGLVHFEFYRKGMLHYKTDDTEFEFTVPIEDCGDGMFLHEDKAILFMRYIRKQMEANEMGRKASLSLYGDG